MKNRYNLMTA